jgi:metal-dependent amidase/aminoacylase/carboxypeptidase family protein
LPILPLVMVAQAGAPCAAAPGLDEAGLIALRRQIHQHPELAGHEVETARRVAEKLRALGLEVRAGVGGHGLVALLRGGKPGPVIAYRADLDAVDDDERAPLAFRSQAHGAAHLCGHDIHVAVAVGIAEIMAAERAQMPGTLKLLFQPAEEDLSGARAMMAAGALANPKPREIYALHSYPLPVGSIAYSPGVGLAGLDRFDLILPAEKSSSDAAALAQRIAALSTIEPPHDGPGWQALLAQLTAQPSSLAQFQWIRARADDKAAVVHVAVKAAHDDDYNATRARITAMAPPHTRVVSIEPLLPGMMSDSRLSEAAVAPLAEVVGRDHLVRVTASVPFNGEDFAYYQREIPGAMFWLGVADPEHGINGLPHSPDFQADERAIAIGARAMAMLLRRRLGERN